MEAIRITKKDVASRQLDAAIQLLFAGADIVAVHTLAGAGSKIASDLIELEQPEKSWDPNTQEVSAPIQRSYFQLMHATQTIFEHADVDPDNAHEFALSDTFALLATAVFNIAKLTGGLTTPQAVYQIWYAACHLDALGESFEHHAIVKEVVGDLSKRTISYQLAVGRRELQEAMKAVV
jgi:hypothetical protein